MAPKVRFALSLMGEAAEAALGWALIVVALYAILFVNFTGNGTLWDSLRDVAAGAAPVRAMDVAVTARVVPSRPQDFAVKAQNRMLAAPEVPEQEMRVPVVAADQPRTVAQWAGVADGARSSR